MAYNFGTASLPCDRFACCGLIMARNLRKTKHKSLAAAACKSAVARLSSADIVKT